MIEAWEGAKKSVQRVMAVAARSIRCRIIPGYMPKNFARAQRNQRDVLCETGRNVRKNDTRMANNPADAAQQRSLA